MRDNNDPQLIGKAIIDLAEREGISYLAAADILFTTLATKPDLSAVEGAPDARPSTNGRV